VEFGQLDEACQTAGKAAQVVKQIQDCGFQQDRRRLVREFRKWLRRRTARRDVVLSELSMLAHVDERRVYLDWASAHWARSGRPDDVECLKTILPLTLNDDTLQDLVFARLVGLRLPMIEDRPLQKMVRLCAKHCLIGRPWQRRPTA
jgi:hypothetical protein